MTDLRTERGLTLREVAHAAGVGFAAVWKMEQSRRLPRGATLAAVLQKGYGLVPSSKTHCEIVAAWNAERSLGSEAAVPDSRQETVQRVLALPKKELEILNGLLSDPALWKMAQAMAKAHFKTSR